MHISITYDFFIAIGHLDVLSLRFSIILRNPYFFNPFSHQNNFF